RFLRTGFSQCRSLGVGTVRRLDHHLECGRVDRRQLRQFSKLSKRRAATARREKRNSTNGARAPRRPNLLAGEDLPPIAQQKRSQDKRAALLKAALALFGKLGFEATSIDQIADSAKVAVGGFYQHF